MKSRVSKRRSFAMRRRNAAAAVEFAIVAPLFLLLLAGIMEFGQAFRVEHILANSSRRGARAAVVEGATTSEVQQKIKSHCVQRLNASESDITVLIAVNGSETIDLVDAEEGDEISLTVAVPYSRVCAGFYANLFANRNLTATCILEHE